MFNYVNSNKMSANEDESSVDKNKGVGKKSKKSFNDQALAEGLKPATVDILQSQDIESTDHLKLLNEQDVLDLSLSIGQRNILKHWIVKLNKPSKKSSTLKPTGFQDEDATQLATIVEESLSLPSSSANQDEHLKGMDSGVTKHLPFSAKPKFSVPRPFEYIKDKKHNSELSMKEFLYANGLILENRLHQKDNDCLGYAKHLTFCCLKWKQGYSAPSILEYDEALRMQVSEMGGKFPCGSDVDLATRFLQKQGPIDKTTNFNRKVNLRVQETSQPCLRWNTGGKDACRGQCKYDHSCLVCGSTDHNYSNCPNKLTTPKRKWLDCDTPETHKISGVSCPLCPQAFANLMDPQDPDYNYILNGVSNGFNLVDINPQLSYECENYKSSLDHKRKLDDLFLQELQQEKLSIVNYKPFCVHAIGAIPCKDRDDPRPITDCSRPHYYAINESMLPEKCCYNTVDTAAKLITPGCWFSVIYIHHAYRSVPIAPEDRKFMGFQWSFGKYGLCHYLVDNFLCFGCRSAPSIFNRLSKSITSMFKRSISHDNIFIVNMLDDFLLVAPTRDLSLFAQQHLISILRRLGFGISWSKVVGPSQSIKFSGIDLNSIDMQLSLPTEKIEELSRILSVFKDKKSASKHELQKLCGHLNFASTVVKGGRTFFSRVLDTMNKLKLSHHRTRLDSEFKKDIVDFWIPFMEQFNGQAKFLCHDPKSIGILQCDSSLMGFGVY